MADTSILLQCDDLPETQQFLMERCSFLLHSIFPADLPEVALLFLPLSPTSPPSSSSPLLPPAPLAPSLSVTLHSLPLETQKEKEELLKRNYLGPALQIIAPPTHPLFSLLSSPPPSPFPLSSLPSTPSPPLSPLHEVVNQLVCPNGTRIFLLTPRSSLASQLPPFIPSLTITKPEKETKKGEGKEGKERSEGRAGMKYLDLISDRQGGRVIASNIAIPEGGEVKDFVHFHLIEFQFIYCYKGWVDVVYEDQGPPFRLHPGDCVLQPSSIRHRVLCSSPGLEVVEICSPAQHATCIDHSLSLPNSEKVREGRGYGVNGHRFVRFVGEKEGGWREWGMLGLEAREMGFRGATDGVGQASVVRCVSSSSCPTSRRWYKHTSEFSFVFVLKGRMVLHLRQKEETQETLEAGDSFVVPADVPHQIEVIPPPSSPSSQQQPQLSDQPLELLHCSIPGDFKIQELQEQK